MHLNGNFFEKLIFWILWKPKSLFSLCMFNLVSINKFQRSRLIFDLSAKVAYIGVSSTYLNIVFSDNSWPIEAKFHITTYDWLAKTYTNCYSHMTNMATMPIYGQNSLNLFFYGTKRSLALGLGIITETASCEIFFLISTGLLSADRRFPYIPDYECIRTSIGFINQ